MTIAVDPFFNSKWLSLACLEIRLNLSPLLIELRLIRQDSAFHSGREMRMHSTFLRYAPLLGLAVIIGRSEPVRGAAVLNSADRSTFVSVSNSLAPDAFLERAGTGPFNTAFGRIGTNSAADATQSTTVTAALGALSFTGSASTDNSANGGVANGPIVVRGDVNCSLNFSVVGQPESVSLSVLLTGTGNVSTSTKTFNDTLFVQLKNTDTLANLVNTRVSNPTGQTITYSALLPVGTYLFEIDADSIGQSTGTDATLTSGSATFSALNFAVTPEPAVWLLASLEMLAITARRRQASRMRMSSCQWLS